MGARSIHNRTSKNYYCDGWRYFHFGTFDSDLDGLDWRNMTSGFRSAAKRFSKMFDTPASSFESYIVERHDGKYILGTEII